jgi:hypothetical protein
LENSIEPVVLLRAFVAVLTLGCSSEGGDSGTASLPPDSASGSDNPDTGQGFFDVDTGPSGDTGLNEEPPYELRISHTGTWERSPLGGPYTDMIGTMSVTESILGGATICNAEFSLTGTVSKTECDHCDEAFDVFFYLVSQGELDDYGEQVLNKDGVAVAGLGMCQFPDIPLDGDTWRLGFAPVDGSLFWDYYDSGIWVPLYDAEELHDEVTFEYETTVGFVPIEEDD